MDAAREAFANVDALVGYSAMFRSDAAMLLDFGAATALARHRARLPACILLDSRRALVEVAGSQAVPQPGSPAPPTSLAPWSALSKGPNDFMKFVTRVASKSFPGNKFHEITWAYQVGCC